MRENLKIIEGAESGAIQFFLFSFCVQSTVYLLCVSAHYSATIYSVGGRLAPKGVA